MRLRKNGGRLGTTFEWDIAQILERTSHDLDIIFGDYRACRNCGIRYCSYYEYDFPCNEGVVACEDKDGDEWAECDWEDVPHEERWETLLSMKRADENYEDILEEISENGFSKPLTAYKRDGVLILCDGHHRLAAAIDLGLETVPVHVFNTVTIADDSGEWYRGYAEYNMYDGEFESELVYA